MNSQNHSYLDKDSASFKTNFLKSNFYLGLSKAKANEINCIEIDEIMKKKFKLNRLADYISSQEKSLKPYKSLKKLTKLTKLKKLKSESKSKGKNTSPNHCKKKNSESPIKTQSPDRKNVSSKRKLPRQIGPEDIHKENEKKIKFEQSKRKKRDININIKKKTINFDKDTKEEGNLHFQNEKQILKFNQEITQIGKNIKFEENLVDEQNIACNNGKRKNQDLYSKNPKKSKNSKSIKKIDLQEKNDIDIRQSEAIEKASKYQTMKQTNDECRFLNEINSQSILTNQMQSPKENWIPEGKDPTIIKKLNESNYSSKNDVGMLDNYQLINGSEIFSIERPKLIKNQDLIQENMKLIQKDQDQLSKALETIGEMNENYKKIIANNNKTKFQLEVNNLKNQSKKKSHNREKGIKKFDFNKDDAENSFNSFHSNQVASDNCNISNSEEYGINLMENHSSETLISYPRIQNSQCENKDIIKTNKKSPINNTFSSFSYKISSSIPKNEDHMQEISQDRKENISKTKEFCTPKKGWIIRRKKANASANPEDSNNNYCQGVTSIQENADKRNLQSSQDNKFLCKNTNSSYNVQFYAKSPDGINKLRSKFNYSMNESNMSNNIHLENNTNCHKAKHRCITNLDNRIDLLKYNLANRLELNRDFSKDVNISFQKRSNSVFKRKFSKDPPPILYDNKSEFDKKVVKPTLLNNLRISSLEPFSNINITRKNDFQNQYKQSLTSLVSNKNSIIPSVDMFNVNQYNLSANNNIKDNCPSLPSLIEKSVTSFHPEIKKKLFGSNYFKNTDHSEIGEDLINQEKNYIILENLKGKIIPNKNVNISSSTGNENNINFFGVDLCRYPNKDNESKTNLENINGKNFKCFSSLKGRIILNKNLS